MRVSIPVDDLDGFHRGDRTRFRSLVREHGPHVLRITQSFASDVQEAEDLFQDVWLRVFERRQQFTGEGPFLAWLLTLARNECLSSYRRARSRRQGHERLRVSGMSDELVWAAPDPAAAVERGQEGGRLLQAMQLLTVRERTAITLRVLEDRDSSEAAALMGCQPATVRSLTRNGMARLRVILNRGGDDGLSGS